MKLHRYTILFVPVLLILFSGCRNQPSVRIGLTAPFSGPASAIGAIVYNSASLAVDQINSRGGINGQKVELLVQDNRGRPELSAQAASALINAGAEAIIGPFTSSMLVPALEVCNSNQVLLFSPVIASSKFAGIDDMFFRFYTSANEDGRRYAEHFVSRGLMSASIVWDSTNREYTEDWRSGFLVRYRDLGGSITVDIGINRNQDNSLNVVASTVLAKKPAALVMILTGFHTATLSQIIRRQDTEIPIYATEWAASSADLLHLGGTAIEGLILLYPVKNNVSNETLSNFIALYNSRFSGPALLTCISTFETVNLLSSAFANRQKHQSLKDSLLQTPDYTGLLQTITIEDHGDIPIKLDFHTIHNGSFIEYEDTH